MFVRTELRARVVAVERREWSEGSSRTLKHIDVRSPGAIRVEHDVSPARRIRREEIGRGVRRDLVVWRVWRSNSTTSQRRPLRLTAATRFRPSKENDPPSGDRPRKEKWSSSVETST